MCVRLQRGMAALFGPALMELSGGETVPFHAEDAFCKPISLVPFMDKEVDLDNSGKHGTVSHNTQWLTGREH